ncbi:MAG: hypothetical protein KDA46_02565, partial [Parvularculaceae bacterium]|nr:hypothetical protein [Parvularculaceae bacterium]
FCRALGWLDEAAYRECTPADRETLLRFHDADYLDALYAAQARAGAEKSDRDRYNFGTMENPVFAGFADRAAVTVGGAIMAARVALGGGVGVHFGGGTHHGRRNRASGFCYLNDPVFAVMSLLDGGHRRVAYVDLDAHHGDGVEAAYSGDDRVLVASIHEKNRWPHTGPAGRTPGGNAVNAPVPKDFCDSELGYLCDQWLAPMIERFAPDSIVLTCGADALCGDPLSTMSLSNVALQNAVCALIAHAPGAVILGGGGYNPWTTVRAWTGLWGRVAGMARPARLPDAIKAQLAGFTCDLVDEDEIEEAWLTSLYDAPCAGPVRDEIKELADFLRMC